MSLFSLPINKWKSVCQVIICNFKKTLNMDEAINTITWDWEDLLKVAFSLLAGFVLGMEREWKDKSAGFKTISIICLGSTLFTVLSYKMGMGESEDATRIASYVVSGIGFLGAGVIFKEGNNVNGLTTASIIWISAAIGMSIGFGQYLTAGVFLLACFGIIVSGSIFNKYIARNVAKSLDIHIKSEDLLLKKDIIKDLKKICKTVKMKQSKFHHEGIDLSFDIIVHKSKLDQLDEYLTKNKLVDAFSY